MPEGACSPFGALCGPLFPWASTIETAVAVLLVLAAVLIVVCLLEGTK